MHISLVTPLARAGCVFVCPASGVWLVLEGEREVGTGLCSSISVQCSRLHPIDCDGYAERALATTADKFWKRPVIKIVAGDWLLAAANAVLLKVVIEQVIRCSGCPSHNAQFAAVP